jgi:hypothetical protein
MRIRVLTMVFLLILLVPVPLFAAESQISTICFEKNDCICSAGGLEIPKKLMNQQCNDLSCSWVVNGKASYHAKIWKEYNASYAQKELAECRDYLTKESQRIKTVEGAVILEEVQDPSTCRLVYSRPTLVKDQEEITLSSMIVYKDVYTISINDDQYNYFETGQEAMSYRSSIETCMKRVVDRHSAGLKIVGTDGEKTLHGTVIATNLPYGTPQPLKYAQVALIVDGKTDQVNRTDANGTYVLKRDLEKGREYRIDVILNYARDNTNYFEIRNAMNSKDPDSSTGKAVEFSRTFTYTGDSDLVQDIDLDQLWLEEGQAGVNPFGIMYVHMTEVLEFYKDVMKEDVHHNLPVTVFLFTDDASAYHTLDSGTIGIGQRFSQVSTVQGIDAQRHIVYHEFSHYMMENMYGKMPDQVSDNRTTEINHGGYTNPGTGDSWGEGFATFMPAAISDYYGHNQCGIYYQRNNLDADNTLAWGMWNAEEYAVAETLWDLYDNPAQMKGCDYRMRVELQKLSGSPLADPSTSTFYSQIIGRSQTRENTRGYNDDDTASIPLTGLWSVMRLYRPDFTSVYTALVTGNPQQKTGIDKVFTDHGFSRNTDEGNREYNAGEPFRDNNGNRIHDDGEYFIDLPRPWILHGTDTIGPAANYQRPQRRSSLEVPGHYIRVNNAVPFYTYLVEYPGSDYLPYVSTVQNIDGTIYVQVPQNPDAKITVYAQGVTTGNPLIFTAKEFNEQYGNSLKQGYYVSHDFQIRGPVPTTAPMPDFGQGGMGGPGTGASGFLVQLLSPTSRAPLFVSVPIAIGALLVLAVVLRKVL